MVVGLVASSVATSACAAFAPHTRLRRPARALDIPTSESGAGCRRSAGDIVSSLLAAPSSWSGVNLPLDARGDFACLSLRDSMSRDSMAACAPSPEEVWRRPLPARRRVIGDLAYVGIDPREYTYDLVPAKGDDIARTMVEVRIHFRGELGGDASAVMAMQNKLTSAAALWSAHSPGGRMTFRFLAVSSLDNPHFDIDLVPGEPRTPFDLTWGAEWSAHLIAHEVGHMMGLDDEYEQLRKTWGHAIGREAAWRADPAIRLEWLRCDLGSLMCDSKGEAAVPLPHHYYVIARRRFCRPTTTGFAFP